MNTDKLQELNEHFLSVEKQNIIKINETLYKRVSKFISFMNKHVLSLCFCVAICSIVLTAVLNISLEYSFLFYAIFTSLFGIPALICVFLKQRLNSYNQKKFYCLPADKETMVKFVAMYDGIYESYLESIFLKNNNMISYNVILNELKRNMSILENRIKEEKTKEIIDSLKNNKHN